MSCIYQIFKVLGGPRSVRNGEEVSHMIPKTAVVRMLHYCHKLDSCKASSFNSWNYMVCKLSISRNFLLLSTHAHMTLINSQRFRLLGLRVFEFILLFRIPEDPVILKTSFILIQIMNPGRVPFYPFSILFSD